MTPAPLYGGLNAVPPCAPSLKNRDSAYVDNGSRRPVSRLPSDDPRLMHNTDSGPALGAHRLHHARDWIGPSEDGGSWQRSRGQSSTRRRLATLSGRSSSPRGPKEQASPPLGRSPRSTLFPAFAVTLVVSLLSLAAVPGASTASTHSSAAASCGGTGGCTLPMMTTGSTAPLHGLVTSCSSASSCGFVFNTTQGLGWANASPPSLSLRLPGEAMTSPSFAYSTYTASLTGTYTYWTVGNLVGTDVNTGKVVYGTTDTNYTITCHGHSGRGGGCTYTYTTDNGTIVVYFTAADATATTVACTPSTIASGGSTVCTATVNDSGNSSARPSGNVSFSGAYGSTAGFSNGGNCTLVSGTCSVSYTAPDEQLGTVPITASFAGTPSFYTSSGRTSVYVTSSDSGGGSFFSTVFFEESGLPNGTEWSVTLGGLLLTSTNSSLPFEVQNGTYSFAVGAVPGYRVSTRTGNVTVAGSDVNLGVTFASVAYPLTFTARGLPLGKTWSLTLDGAEVRTADPSLSFDETNGTHAYLLQGPAGFRISGVTPTGELTVAGAPVSISFSFERGPTYTILFAEKGLPQNATWCVILGTIACSSTTILRFANLTPGQYGYAVVPMTGQVISAKLGRASLPLSQNLTVFSHSFQVSLHYTYPYLVTFAETGLPAGTNWRVTVAGVVEHSTSSTIVFELGNGTHAYHIGSVTGYIHSSAPSRARVSGGPAAVSVTYRP